VHILLAQQLGIADNDQPVHGPGDSYVHSFVIADKPDPELSVCLQVRNTPRPHSGNQNDLAFLSLLHLDGACFDQLQILAFERFSYFDDLFALRSNDSDVLRQNGEVLVGHELFDQLNHNFDFVLVKPARRVDQPLLFPFDVYEAHWRGAWKDVPPLAVELAGLLGTAHSNQLVFLEQPVVYGHDLVVGPVGLD